jgi:hypothetical protein
VECQKVDWKVQKIICHLIKRMPDAWVPIMDVCLVSKDVVNQTSVEIAKLGAQKHIILLQHAPTFMKNQFGKYVAGTSEYARESGDRMHAWDVACSYAMSIPSLALR